MSYKAKPRPAALDPNRNMHSQCMLLFAGLPLVWGLLAGSFDDAAYSQQSGITPDPHYGLQSDDVRQIQDMVEGGESSSQEELSRLELPPDGVKPYQPQQSERSAYEQELARRTSERNSTTTVSVPLATVPIWLFVVTLLVAFLGAIYWIARQFRGSRCSNEQR